MNLFAKTLIILLLSQSLPFSIFLFLTSRGRRISNILLGIFFLILSLQIIFLFTVGIHVFGFALHKLTFLIGIWYGPVLLLYIKSVLLKENENLNFRKNWIHLFPSLFFWILVFFTERYRTIEVYDSFICTSYFIYSFVYFRRKLVSKSQTDLIGSALTIKWINAVLFTLIFVSSIDLLELAVRLVVGTHPFNNYIFYIEIFGFLIVLEYYIFFWATRSDNFMGINDAHTEKSKKPKYASIEMTEDESLALYNQINSVLTEKELFLKKNIKITELAKMLEVPINKVSRSVNENYGQSFSDLVNSKRVIYAKKLLSNPKNNNKLFAIALDSGFNNKVSFYKNFKKIVGMSPSEYRFKKSGWKAEG